MNLWLRIRLFIGRIERCAGCGKPFLNRSWSLYQDLANEDKGITYCHKCYPKPKR